MTLAADAHLAGQLDDAEPTVHKEIFFLRVRIGTGSLNSNNAKFVSV